jgi:hypothetical protein
VSSIPSHSISDAAVKALYISLIHVTTENMSTGYASGDTSIRCYIKLIMKVRDGTYMIFVYQDSGGRIKAAKDRLIRHCRHFIDTRNRMGRFRAGLHSRASKVKLTLVLICVGDVELELAYLCHMRVALREACGI